MRHNKLSLFYHFVWTTWDREALITSDIERELHRFLQSQAERLKCVVIAIGGVEDHVHMLVEMPPTLCISDWMHDVKGSSSHFANHALHRDSFKWRGSYAAFSVSYYNCGKIKRYINNQKEHHAQGTLILAGEAEYEEGDELPYVASE